MAVGVLAAVLAAVALTIALTGPASSSSPPGHAASGASRAAGSQTSAAAVPAKSPARPTSFAVGLRVLRFVDTSRSIEVPGAGSQPRALVTVVRYPALGPAGATDVHDAPAARAAGPFPLIVFGHGFAVTPALYARLLQDWARAGYVVAAPVFPLENANAPGGPNESDLPNQPADMRFVISQMRAAGNAGSGPLAGLVNGSQIAVSGQSDGGDTALAVAYDQRFRDPSVGAAVILSGAEIPGIGEFTFPAGGPPLLATQGTADTVNPPSFTNTFFEAARTPKYLLSLLGAEHLPPYSDEQPQLDVVAHVSIAFLDSYLKHSHGALQRMTSLGRVPGVATLQANP